MGGMTANNNQFLGVRFVSLLRLRKLYRVCENCFLEKFFHYLIIEYVSERSRHCPRTSARCDTLQRSQLVCHREGAADLYCSRYFWEPYVGVNILHVWYVNISWLELLQKDISTCCKVEWPTG